MDTKRFQTSKYRQQINAARHYQRKARPKPFTSWQKFLHHIGLGTILMRILAILFLAAVVYLTYFASFMKIKEPAIKGADQEASIEVLARFHDYERTYLYNIFPQKNILYFSPQRFTEFLLSRDYKIASVTQIKRKLPNEMSITVNQRVPVYALKAKDQFFLLNSDGNISNKIDEAAAANYPHVLDIADEQVQEGEKFIADQAFSFLSYMKDNFESKTGMQVDRYEIPGRGSDQIVVYTKKGFKVMFDSHSDPGTFLDRFTKLWASMQPDQQNGLVYADLRFDVNAYACYRGSPCAESKTVPTPTPSASPSVTPTPNN